ncbi:hypothetical protein BDW74DRAFT_177835 [Aspergillus multicolor]|uniref:uncharacterized protein n=1 Tax=Aspergillus multicolor TaxID=41759 RepID=UPI003CCD05F8
MPIWTAICAGILLLINGVPLSSKLTSSTDLTAERILRDGLQQCHEIASRQKGAPVPSADRHNPRWNAVSGQKTSIVIQNATLFDGETTLPYVVDIVFNAGVVRSVTPTDSNYPPPEDAEIINIHRKHITPGLVDLHSHHGLLPFPSLSATSDANERPFLGPITPFVRATDGFTPSDPAIRLIASGGVTSSLVLPGSANIVGGQAYPVKNLPYPGAAAEPVIDELLLEDGIQEPQRQRYLKMACGENPRRVYGHTRMGLAWLLRQELNKAKELLEKQETWCAAASDIQNEHNKFNFGLRHPGRVTDFVQREGPRPDSFELETFLALLRGEINLNVHCYTPEDLETMLSVLHEFGVHPRAFHHALEAWQVPELLRSLEPNVTIATFADNALFKAEAYDASLEAPKILHEHGVRFALKSDHTGESNYAKYLLDQVSIAHSYGLPTDAALQSVTSIPAESMQQGHRIGYVRPGYDADLVIWDSHPLQIGATAVEVFIDGRPLLNNDVKELSEELECTYRGLQSSLDISQAPATRPFITTEERTKVCSHIQEAADQGAVVFTGIKEALIDIPGLETSREPSELVLVLEVNKAPCLGLKSTCIPQSTLENPKNITEIPLQNGYITPGLIAFGNNLGIQDIPSEPSTGDGTSTSGIETVHFAKYGVHLHGKGKAFGRARIGGVTRAVTPPHGSGVLQGVSVGIRTGPEETLLDGGVWKDEVALHFRVGQGARDDRTPTISSVVETVRRVLEQGGKGEGDDDVYVQAVNGSLPVVVQAYNPDDIAQLILIKRDFPVVNLVIYGGHGAALLAKPLADAGIPVILSGNRGAPDTWEKKDTLPGPPLSDSPAKVLLDAGVLLGLAVKGDSKVHGLAREARWAGKFAGLSDGEAIKLVSTNIETILGLGSEAEEDSGGYNGDFVLWEGNPLRGDGAVVASVKEDGRVNDCWPEVD